jgi:hypothetical protein
MMKVTRGERPSYKLRFPATASGLSEYLTFTKYGSLLIETEEYSRPYDERCTWLEPDDTIRFLNSIGEEGWLPEFTEGDPTPQTRAMLRRIIKQFSSIDDLHRCWRIIGVSSKSFNCRDTD